MANVFFHIGMHKTATSWFQRQLFPAIDGASLVSSKKMDEIAAALAAFDAQTSGKAAILLVSHEGLGGTISWEREPSETLERLSRNLADLMTLRPDAAVIIGYREHERWLASAFAQRAKQNWGVTWEAYLARFSIAELMWCHHLGLIESLCPSVFPYLYEELIQSPETLVEDLCLFIGRPLPSNIETLLRIRENPSPRSRVGQAVSAMSWPAIKLANLSARESLKGGLRSFDSLFSARRVQLPAGWEARLRQDWNALVDLVGKRRGRDLSRFHATEPASAPLGS